MKKISIIFCLVSIFMFILTTSCFAAMHGDLGWGDAEKGYSKYIKYYVPSTGEDAIFLFYSTDEVALNNLILTRDGNNLYMNAGNNSISFSSWHKGENDDEFNFTTSYWFSSTKTVKIDSEYIIYSDYDIYEDSTGEIFFQQTPQVITQVATMEITQVEELPRAIIQIIQIILPVFLIVFGVLLVLYLIKSKNLLHL